MAPVRWRNETIPFGIRKTGLEAISSGVLEESKALPSAEHRYQLRCRAISCSAPLITIPINQLKKLLRASPHIL